MRRAASLAPLLALAACGDGYTVSFQVYVEAPLGISVDGVALERDPDQPDVYVWEQWFANGRHANAQELFVAVEDERELIDSIWLELGFCWQYFRSDRDDASVGLIGEEFSFGFDPERGLGQPSRFLCIISEDGDAIGVRRDLY